jgi:CheY-like chemotaxis protein
MSTGRNGEGRVLVAEDEPTIRRVTVRLLASSGYEAEGADDGEAAWTALNREPFDLLITDHCMPRLSGVELLKRLRSARMDLPVIMVSGSMPTEELERHPWLRLDDRLLKPYSAADLLRRVAQALNPGAPARGLGSMVRNWFEQPAAVATPHR